jgi:putative transposase
LKNHAQTAWVYVFLPVIDLFFRTVYVFFPIELSSRIVVHFGMTRHPTDAWVAQQLREATPYDAVSHSLVRDNDPQVWPELTGLHHDYRRAA